jgi:hypothetical protein
MIKADISIKPAPGFRMHGDVPPYPLDFHSAISLNIATAAALSRPDTGTVTNHAPTIFLWN